MRRIGVLTTIATDDPDLPSRVAAFLQGLQQFGWTTGRNINIVYRHAGNDQERLKSAARELLAMMPDTMLVHGNPSVAALRTVNPSFPAVFVQVGDPVGSAFVDSLSRPGGYLTGFTTMEPEMGSKWLELLKETAPALANVMVLLQPDITANFAYTRAVEAAGVALKVAVQVAGVHDANAIEGAVSAIAREPNAGLIVMPNPVTSSHRELIARLAIAHRLPFITPFRSYVASGGLMCYGPDVPDLFRRSAGYIDRILKGDKPADLPVQVPIKFELILNLKTAKAIGLEMPLFLQQRADEVIE